MKLHHLAAAFATVSFLFLTACASGPETASTQTGADPCLGVRPATGTMLVRKEDCGVRPQQSVGPTGQPQVDPKRQ